MTKKDDNSAKRVTTSIRIDPDLWHKAKMKALEKRKSIGEYIEELITEDLSHK